MKFYWKLIFLFFVYKVVYITFAVNIFGVFPIIFVSWIIVKSNFHVIYHNKIMYLNNTITFLYDPENAKP